MLSVNRGFKNSINKLKEKLKKLSKKEFAGIFGRWGGEEFLIALPYSTIDKAKYIADEIRESVESYVSEDESKKGETLKQQISISLGVSSMDLTEIAANSEDAEKSRKRIIQEAETALDYAKFIGRNNVKIFEKFLAQEIENLKQTRKLYFTYSCKKPLELRDVLFSEYLLKYPKIKGKIIKHFNFIRTEINSRDTRTQAVLADNLYKFISTSADKRTFLDFLKIFN